MEKFNDNSFDIIEFKDGIKVEPLVGDSAIDAAGRAALIYRKKVYIEISGTLFSLSLENADKINAMKTGKLTDETFDIFACFTKEN